MYKVKLAVFILIFTLLSATTCFGMGKSFSQSPVAIDPSAELPPEGNDTLIAAVGKLPVVMPEPYGGYLFAAASVYGFMQRRKRIKAENPS